MNPSANELASIDPRFQIGFWGSLDSLTVNDGCRLVWVSTFFHGNADVAQYFQIKNRIQDFAKIGRS